MKVKKKTLRKMSRALAFMMAVVIVLTSLGLDSLVVNAAGTTDPTQIKPGLDVTPSSVLGEAINYGLVANDMTFHGHFETNFATKTLHTDINNEANGPKADGFVGNIVIAEYKDMQDQSGLMYDPNYATGKTNTGVGTIYTTPEAVKKFSSNRVKTDANGDYYHTSPTPTASLQFDLSHSKDDLSNYVDSMVTAAEKKSAELNSESDKNGINYADIVDSSSGIKMIDIAKYNTTEGTYYINFTSSDWDAFRDGDGGRFRLASGQKVVLNITGSDITLSKFFIVHAEDDSQYNSDGDKAEMAERFIFNFPNATNVTISGSVDGTFLAPYAYVDQRIVAGGWLVANSYSKVAGQEWHLNNPLKPNTPGFPNNDDSFVDITINKTSSIGAEATGAEFQLYSDSACQNAVEMGSSTSKMGAVTFTGIKYDAKNGSVYYLKETKALSGHILDTNTYKIAIAADGTYKLTDMQDNEIANKTLVNKPEAGTTTVSFRKVNEDLTNPSPLSGASFALYSDANCTSQVGTTVTTGTDGIVSFANVSYSRENATVYYIKETTAPDGYVAYPNVIKVTVGTDGVASFESGVVNGDLSNSLLTTSIEFTKVDKNGNAGLNGAEFEIYSDAECTTKVGFTTSQAVDSKNGVVKFADIKYSQNNITTYYIKETKAPDGYMGTTDVITVTVNKDGTVNLSSPIKSDNNGNIRLENEEIKNPTSITFTKVDENGEGLAGAEFKIFSDADCTQLKGTATSGNNGVVTFGNLEYSKNADTKYYIKETKAPDFYQPLNSVITVTINKSNVASFSAPVVDGKVVNNPLVKSEFKFVKMNEKGAPLKDVEFKLEGNGYSETAKSGTDGIVIFKNIPYSLNKNTEYTLSETTTPAGYKAIEPKTITVDTDGVLHLPGFMIQPNVTPMLINEENMGKDVKVEFTKVDLYNKTKVVPGAEFKLYNEAGYQVGAAVTSNDNGKVVFDKLTYSTVPGNITKYTIKETKTPAGYIESGAVINVSIDSRGTVTITGANVDGAKVTNTPITGSLKITKTIKGDLTLAEINGDLTFTVTNNDTNVSNTYTVAGDFVPTTTKGVYVLELPNTPIGGYTVVESVVDQTGYTHTVSYSVNSGASTTGDTATVAVEEGKTSTVDYTNDYTKNPGTLKITKTIEGDLTAEEAAGDLSFTVENTATGDSDVYYINKHFTKNANGVYELVLPETAGTYKVTETVKDRDGYTYTVSYVVNGETKTGATASVTVASDKESVVAYTNKYTKNPGTLKITKTIEGDLTADEAAGDLSFTVENTATGDSDVYYINKHFTKNANGVYELVLPETAGKYEVTETVKDHDGYTYTAKYSVDGSSYTDGKTATVTVTSDKESVVAYKNEYKEIPPTTGTLKITKTIEGDLTAEEAAGDLKFTVKNTATGETKDYTIVPDFTLNADGVYELVLTETAGTYEVTETVRNRDGYVLTSTYSVNGAGPEAGKVTDVTVTAGHESVVDYKNVYDAIDGTFSKQTLNPGNASYSELPGASMKLTSKDADLSSVTPKDATKTAAYKFDNTNGTITWTSGNEALVLTKLPVGSYKLEETAELKGYKVSSAIEFTVNADGTMTITSEREKLEETFALSVPTQNYIVMFDAVIPTTDAKFSKVELGEGDAYKELPGASMKLTSDNADLGDVTTKNEADKDAYGFNNTNGTITWTSGSSPLELTKLPEGTYTLEETKAPGDGKYQVASEIKFTIDENGKITVDATSASCVSTDDQKANNIVVMLDELNLGSTKLAFTKVDANNTNKAVKGAKFELYKDGVKIDSAESDDAGSVVFANKLTYSVAKGATTTYTVKEVGPADGYVLATGEITVSIDSTGKITMSGANVIADTMKVTNVPQTGTLKITKTIEGDLTPDEAKGDLTFTVKNTATGETKDYTINADFTKNTDGVYELVLTETVGDYEVTESVKTREGYTLSVSYTVNGGTSTEGKISNVTVTADNESVVAYTNKYTEKPGTLKITKTIKGDLKPEEIEGALWFEVTEPDGKTTEKYTIKDDFTNVSGVYEKVITNVKPGDYTVKEFDETKDGYLVAVSYKINGGDAISGKNATVAVTAGNDSVVAYTNDYTAIEGTFSKQTLKPGDTSYSELPDASLKLTSNDADLSKVTAKNPSDVTAFDNTKGVITWKSGNKPLVLTKLPAGSYTLTETAKLDDYEISSDVTFTVNDDGTMTLTGEKAKLEETYKLSIPEQNLIVMFDAVDNKPVPTTDVTFSKKAIMGGSELVGAEITVEAQTDVKGYDADKVVSTSGHDITKDGRTVTWTSTDKPLVLAGLPDGTYVMTEIAAPSGYDIATVIEFQIVDGKVAKTANTDKKIQTSAIVAEPHNVITMIDDATTMVSFDKRSIKLAGDSLAGAKLQIHNADGVTKLTNVYTTNGESVLSDDELYISWTSTGDGTTPIQFWGLPNGLYVLEETEAPISSEYVYHKADPIAFRVDNGIIRYQATERKDDGSVVYNEPDNWILVVDLGDPITPPGNPPSNPPSNPPKRTPPSNPPKNDPPSNPPSDPPTPKDPPKNPPTPNPPANPPQVPPKTPGKKATVTINDNKTPLAGNVTMAGDVNTGNLTGDEFANEGFVYAILSLIAAISLIGAALLGRKKED